MNRKPCWWLGLRDKRTYRFLWQRITRGFCDAETWSLDYRIADFVLPRLRRFQDINCGYPSSLSEKRWKATLAKMIRGFEAGRRLCDMAWETQEEWQGLERDLRIGMKAFARWYPYLWW